MNFNESLLQEQLSNSFFLVMAALSSNSTSNTEADVKSKKVVILEGLLLSSVISCIGNACYGLRNFEVESLTWFNNRCQLNNYA